MVQRHLLGLRRQRVFNGSCFVLAIERNYGGAVAHGWLETALTRDRRLRPLHVLAEASGASQEAMTGVITNLEKKKNYIQALYQYLHDGRMCWADAATFVTSAEPKAIQSELNKQMLKFRQDITKKDDGRDSVLRIHGKGRGDKDDLMLATMIALFWALCKRHDSHFLQMARARGWVN